LETIVRKLVDPGGSFFLFGPRGTGKTSWLRQAFPDALTVDLLDPETFRACVSRPERLVELIDGRPEISVAVVDEVQKAPGLLDVVHRLIEDRSRRKIRFVLTGSSARKLRRTGGGLLGGRLSRRVMHPFLASELGERFDLEKTLGRGLLPLVLASSDPEETLRGYVSLYLKEEVQAEGLVRNIGSFARFLEAVSFSHGSVLNVSAVARECQVGQKTVEGFVEVLEDLLLGFRLRPFTRRAQRRMVQHPKFYLFDAGIFRSLRPAGPLDRKEEIGGAALEGLVAQHLRAWIDYGSPGVDLFFWRTKAGLEVDFVVYGNDEFSAIEVKSSRSVFPGDIKPLHAFLEDHPKARACLLYGGRERLRIAGVPCIPCSQFLLGLSPGKDLPLR